MYKKILKSTLMVSLLIPVAANAGTITSQGDVPGAGAASPAIAGTETDTISTPVTQRPLADWLDAQGQSATFFSPVGDYVGWTDLGFTIFALVDYAGVAERDLKLANPKYRRSLGTNVIGVVKEQVRPDGRALVTVDTWTINALGFAQSIAELETNNFNFLKTSTIFGNKAVDVANGQPAALGPVKMHVSFVIESPGDPLPDFVNVPYDNICDYVPYEISFSSSTYSKLPGGTSKVMRVEQKGYLNESDCAQEPKPTYANFTEETIEIIDLK